MKYITQNVTRHLQSDIQYVMPRLGNIFPFSGSAMVMPKELQQLS